MVESPNPNNKIGWHQRFLSVFLVVIALVLIAGGYCWARGIKDQIKATEVQAAAIASKTQHLQIQLEQLQETVQTWQNQLQKAYSNQRNSWQLIVIEHLVRMADLTLNTTKDSKLALSFLLTAQQYAKSPGLSVINHALNRDIASLQAIKVIEPETLILRIEALRQQLDALPMVTKTIPSLPGPQHEESIVAKNLWQRIFITATNALKDLVIIRRQTVEPLLSIDQASILSLNLQTKLLQAELAVGPRQNKLYQSSLTQASNMITRYLLANSTAASDILSSLQELQQIDLSPPLPPLTESITAIMEVMNSSNQPQNDATKPAVAKLQSS